ncbi:hypothetical protein QN277_019103 [Acacia crassicarpa]|uniref:Integrase catalytic domain-containing protein n=1 Tax=Acacia crassicarpa TaxID=499986 RepID=A0AAE1MS74_9FABA|nr:hypothetical protein QN277_019103 [Acacia crassicarpa]
MASEPIESLEKTSQPSLEKTSHLSGHDSMAKTMTKISPSSDSLSSYSTQKRDFVTFSHLVSVKLEEHNYLLWKQQISTAIRGHDLQQFIDKTVKPPAQYLTIGDDGEGLLNPVFLDWQRQDHLLMSWMTCSMSEGVLTRVVGCDSSLKIWEKLQIHFTSQTKAKLRQLKTQLKSIKLQNLSVNAYLLKLKGIIDALSAIGHPISESDHIDQILEGLPEAYDPFVTSVTSRKDPYTVDEIEALLLSQETRLEQHQRASEVTTNVVHTRGSSRGSFGRGRRGGRSGGRDHGSRPRGGANSMSRSTSSASSTRSAVQCQICKKNGHEARSCWYRYDDDFQSLNISDNNGAQKSQSANLVSTDSVVDPDWYLDSGATTHVTHDESNIPEKSGIRKHDSISVGDGFDLSVNCSGNSSVSVSPTASLHLSDVLHVPSMSKNLLSIYRLCLDNNILISFFSNVYVIKDLRTHKELFRGYTKTGLYPLRQILHHLRSLKTSRSSQAAHLTTSSVPQSSPSDSVLQFRCNTCSFVTSSAVSSFRIWHNRLGHSSSPVVSHIMKLCNVFNNKNSSFDFCNSCCLAKSHKQPFPDSLTQYTKPLQLIHTDIWGPAPQMSLDGYKYYIHFTDAFSRYVWFYPLRAKSEAYATFLSFKAMVELQFHTSILAVQSDSGAEFLKIGKYLHEHGILHRLSCPYTHEQNDVAKRKHRSITEIGLTLLANAALPFTLWPEAFHTAVYLANRLPSRVLAGVSPFQTLFGHAPGFQHLRTFGCLCFPHTRPYNKHKMQYRSVQCIFIGYSPVHKGYRCWDPRGRVYVSRDVIFNESEFPYSRLVNCSHSPFSSSAAVLPPGNPPIAPTSQQLGITGQDSVSVPSSSVAGVTLSPAPAMSQERFSSGGASPVSALPVNTSLSTSVAHSSSSASASAPTSVPSRMVTRSMNGIYKPKALIVDTSSGEPTSVSHALNNPVWKAAMDAEYAALISNQTWHLVSLPPNRSAIGCKWIFKKKTFPDGTWKNKARLVAKGFHQQEGFDFKETFSPVVKPVTIRLILSLAVANQWSIRQIDVNNAFLNGFLKEEVYMVQPPGYESSDKSLVCRLDKALYGLKQAPRAWFERLGTALHNFGFSNSKCDQSLFIRKTLSDVTYVLVYVDDIILTGTSAVAISALISALHDQFALKDLGPLTYFLGIEVKRLHDGSLFLSQAKYIRGVLAKAGFTKARPDPTPMSSGTVLVKAGSQPLVDISLYRTVVGSLQYATITHPEISFAVSKVCQFMQAPCLHHWKAVKRILRYLAGSLTHGLLLKPSLNHTLVAFCDADWATDRDDRRNVTGYCVYFGPNLISWSLLSELNVRLVHVPRVFCDNLSAVLMTANPILHARTKHLELDLHFVREHAIRRDIRVCHIPSSRQVADGFTKSIPRRSFAMFKKHLGVLDVP